MKTRIDAEHSATGGIGLALSCGGILLFVVAAVVLWVGANRPPQGNCTNDASGSTCYYAQSPSPPDPLVLIGVLGLVTAPFLSVVGWTVGNGSYGIEARPSESRRTRPDRAPLGRAVSWVCAGPSRGSWKIDGPSVGKAGLILMALLVLAVLGASAVLAWELSQVEVPGM